MRYQEYQGLLDGSKIHWATPASVSEPADPALAERFRPAFDSHPNGFQVSVPSVTGRAEVLWSSEAPGGGMITVLVEKNLFLGGLVAATETGARGPLVEATSILKEHGLNSDLPAFQFPAAVFILWQPLEVVPTHSAVALGRAVASAYMRHFNG
jgi:hypothetical protein